MNVPLNTVPDSTQVVAALRGSCVLLAEDSDVIRDVSRSLLEDAGVAVDEAHDGAMALAKACNDAAHYCLILMDVQMPVMDGLTATRTIRAKLGDRAPPIVAMTAQTADSEKQACADAGMVAHMTKPIDPDELVEVVNRYARRRSQFAGGIAAPAHNEAASAALVELPHMPGFDLQFALRSVGGKAPMLRSMLARFADTYVGVVPRLRALIAAAQFGEAHRLAHTLKGTAATFGAAHIALVAEKVDDLLRPLALSAGNAGAAAGAVLPGRAISDGLDELESLLHEAVPTLRSLRIVRDPVAAGAAAGATQALPQRYTAEFAQLRRLLAGNSYAARKAFFGLRANIGDGGEHWQAATAAVEKLDFKQALAQLDARYPVAAGDSL